MTPPKSRLRHCRSAKSTPWNYLSRHGGGRRVTDVSDADKIEAAIREATDKSAGELTKADLEKVTMLFIKRRDLTDVSSLTGLRKLEVLGLDGNQLADVSPLAELTQLKLLHLNNNKLTDVSSLAKLTQLKELYLYNNNLTNVSVLARLTQLEILHLGSNHNLTKAKIDKLQKALPRKWGGLVAKCKITHNAEQ